MARAASTLEQTYEDLKREASVDLKSPKVSALLAKLVRGSLTFLSQSCDSRALASSVPGKEYFAFKRRGRAKSSRPVNQGLFDIELTQRALSRLVDGDLASIPANRRDKALYTSAMSYCCANDLLKTDDRKTPATFFEILVGHLIASVYSTSPGKEIQVLAQQRTLPTDFVFDLGPDKSKLHVPVKISTRERIIQVWAHQRVLDGVYGINHFRGVLVCLTETNMVRRTQSVVEVCLPDQWEIYQTFIAQMHRIYYFDPPSMYARLASRYPFIQVKSFSSFFDEGDRLAGPPTS